MALKKKVLLASIAFASVTAVANIYDYPLFWNDPLVSEQWHLKNTGQTGFSLSSGVAGNDLDVDFTHAMGIKGRGVTVAVVDTGLEIDHPDLEANVVPGSINLIDGSDYPQDNHGHGTSVGGLIGAVENNGLGGRGVAPHASLIGFNFLDEQSMTSWMLSHGVAADGSLPSALTHPRVFNQSYGRSPGSPQAYDYTQNPALELEDLVHHDVSMLSHGGRGAMFVKSAGNSYRYYRVWIDGTTYYVLPNENGGLTNNNGLPYHNANIDVSNSNFWNVVVSATNATGERASYSSVGSNVFLTAPAGEFGRDNPAMVTTDLTGCDKGSNVASAAPHQNSLHGGTELDPNCDYRGTMNGTSSSAPNTAGAVAAVMSANHALDVRTVKHVLAKTARKTDPSDAGVDLTFENAQGETVTYNAIPGWQTNAAGYHFHNDYGLGAVNLDSAVYEVMTNYAGVTSNLPALQVTDWESSAVNAEIPDASLNGVVTTHNSEQDLTIEAVQVKLNIDHERIRDLAIELVSPSGTRSVLMSPRTGFVSGNYVDSVMLNYHFYGENSKGDWTLRVIDTDKRTHPTILWDLSNPPLAVNAANNTQPGLVKDWSIRFYGH